MFDYHSGKCFFPQKKSISRDYLTKDDCKINENVVLREDEKSVFQVQNHGVMVEVIFWNFTEFLVEKYSVLSILHRIRVDVTFERKDQ